MSNSVWEARPLCEYVTNADGARSCKGGFWVNFGEPGVTWVYETLFGNFSHEMQVYGLGWAVFMLFFRFLFLSPIFISVLVIFTASVNLFLNSFKFVFAILFTIRIAYSALFSWIMLPIVIVNKMFLKIFEFLKIDATLFIKIENFLANVFYTLARYKIIYGNYEWVNETAAYKNEQNGVQNP